MFLSGVVVSCRPEHFSEVEHSLKAVPGIEIHQTDAASGRLVVVIAEDSIEAETEQFNALKKIEGVVDVSLVVHRKIDESEDCACPGSCPSASPAAQH